MIPGSVRRIRVVHDQREALAIGRLSQPFQRRRKIRSFAGVKVGNHSAVRKSSGDQFEGHDSILRHAARLSE